MQGLAALVHGLSKKLDCQIILAYGFSILVLRIEQTKKCETTLKQ